MNLEFEKKKLKSYLGVSLYEELKNKNAIIAGGMITSLFTNSKINDVDIYFRSNSEMYSFVNDNIGHVVSHTKKATQWYEDNIIEDSLLIQVIHYKTFANAKDIFNNYDFTVCMGAFDFESEEFVLDENFIKHNSQRILKFNEKTEYPIISAIRTNKYKDKGYYLSKAEFIKIMLTIMNKSNSIKSYSELTEQLGGMYGESYDRIFENLEDEEFDLIKVIELISNLSMEDSYFEEYKPVEYSVNEILEFLDKEPRNITIINGINYRIINDDLEKYNNNKIDRVFPLSEVLRNIKLYKFVIKNEDGTFSSLYDRDFIYEIGKTAEARTITSAYRSGVLYFNTKGNIEKSTYYGRSNAVLIEVSLNASDVKSWSDDMVTASKCHVIREVPKEEWE